MEQRYETYKKASTTGSAAKRDPNRRIRMRYSDYKRTIKATAIATAIAVSAILAGGNVYVDKISKDITLGKMQRDFHIEYIAPETHRTDDNEHYFYDYSDIAYKMDNSENYEETLYFLVKDIGEYQANRVLTYTEYKDFDTYLATHNYKDEKDFDKTISKKILLEQEIDKKNVEINDMLKDHQPTPETNIYGGNK